METEKSDKKKKMILILDDDSFLLDMYALKFTQSGYEIVPFSDSNSALEKLREGLNPDAMLVDIVMPVMDGFELIRKIRELKLAPGAKVIVLSNLGEEKDMKEGERLKVAGYIVKASHTPSEVVTEVERILGD